jgi:hypothetical protein
MTTDRDFDRIAMAWLADGPEELSDRVIDAVVDDIHVTPQRHALRLPWRFPSMTTPFRIAAAAGIGVLVLGGALYVLQPGSSSPGGSGPTRSPSPSPSPSAPSAAPTATVAPTTSPSAVYPSWLTDHGDGAGILPAGSQTTRQFLAGSTFTVPEGWVNDNDFGLVFGLFPDTPANQAEYAISNGTAQDITLTNRIANNMGVICDATGLFQGTTASDVIDWIVANEAFSTTEPVDVTIGGLNGLQVDLRLSPGWTGSCPLSADDPPTRDYADFRGRFIALDTPDGGSIGIWIGCHYSADSEAFFAEAMPIVDSFRFNLAP